MPKGGKRPGAGRPKGAKSKVTLAARVIASRYAEQILKQMAHLALNAEYETVRVSAGKEVLDRAYGKSIQPVSAQVEVGLSDEMKELMQRYDGQSRSVPKAANGAVRGPGMAPGQHLLDS
jgi:hypothetical protein